MERTQGIIIRTADYREKDRLLVLFTPCGIETVTARGVRSADSKLKSGAVVMTFGEFTFGGRGNKRVLTGADVTDNFFSAWTDIKKISAAMTCFELTEKCFGKDDETAEEFVFLLKIIKELVYGQSEPVCQALRYAVFCARKVGVDYSEIAGYDEKAYELIETFGKVDAEDVGTLPFTVESVSHALTLVANVFANYLGVRLSTLRATLK